jgi:hypothetical protein
MPHARTRHVGPAFQKLCSFSPIVGIFGHRQVGKTTFLETHSNDYRSLDDGVTLRAAQSNPSQFLTQLKGSRSAIDECQLAPLLFPALKLWVQRHKKPGQFLLSGSVRFTSRRAIRESLTGRISTVELFPFVLSEIRQDELPDFLCRALEATSFANFLLGPGLSANDRSLRQKDYDRYLDYGGLPGLCFIRESRSRDRLMQDILRTVLDRDLRLVYETPLPFSDLNALCIELAMSSLKPIEIAATTRKIGIAPRTLKHLINAMESIFLLRALPIEGGGRKGVITWFEDQYEQNFFAQNKLSIEAKRVGLAYRNARAQFEYRLGATPSYFYYLTRAGSSIPLAIRSEKGVLGILPLESSRQLTRATKGAIYSFLRSYNNSKVLVTLDANEKAHVLDDRVLVAPVTLVY